MPYQPGNRLPGERSSRTAHLEVLTSPLVTKLVESFRNPQIPEECKTILWEPLPDSTNYLKIIFGVDGSYQTVNSDKSPYSSISFVKTAIMIIDSIEIGKLDKENPHPLMLRKIMEDSAVYHSTAFPLRNVQIPEMPNNYHAIRKIIFESFKDPYHMQGQIMETFKWIVYEKWSEGRKELPPFACPHSPRDNKHDTTLFFDTEIGKCDVCGKEVYVTDMLGFHLSMGDDFAPEEIPSTYMTIHETLLLLTPIKYYWEYNKKYLSDCLFVKDGPLSVRAQYSKLVQPIRNFLAYARNEGYPIHIIGQEKSGAFYDHFQFISNVLPSSSVFIPQDHYIKKEIQGRPLDGAQYGKDTNYGIKVFLKINDYHKMVLNIPTGEFNGNPSSEDLIGYERIIATLPKIISNRHEGALLPIELAHGIVSLSTYPSAKILKLFSESSKDNIV